MDYVEIGTLLTFKGAVSLAYGKDLVMPWRCTYRGAGHYFSSPEILAGYCCGRGWIQCHRADDLVAELVEMQKIIDAGIMVF